MFQENEFENIAVYDCSLDEWARDAAPSMERD
jgi:hypothetical protein